MTILSIYAIYGDAWFVDSETSQHLTFQKEVFSTYEEFTSSHKMYFENNSMLDVYGKNIIVLNLSNDIFKCIRDVLYILKLANNLLSINKLMEQGFKVEFEATKCWLKSSNSNQVIVEAIQERKFYKLVGVVQSLVCSTKIKNSNLKHHKLGHVFM